ncbi:serine-protein kinase ATM [Lepeophtheirus salmonis]|uniref:serine-protein kinase ATM n=1 Tax=Lepeophtheirus salmonis TaxID=72036 RepID=UPI001AEB4C72|nr:serine-protein kinase ATM-like [Lepeophtheirus salmonis]
MRILSEVRDHCLGLDNDRITIRKKSEESLTHLLHSPRFVQALNAASSSENNRKDFNWDDVYHYAFRFLQREGPKGGGTPSQRLASTLLKTVVRKAGLLLKNPGIIVRDMLQLLLENSSLRDNFGFDAVSVIERIISYHEYCRLLPVPLWTSQLPKAAFSLFECPPKDSDFLGCARFFKKVIQMSSAYSEIAYSSRLTFLVKIINDVKLGAGAFEARSAFLSATLFLLKEFERDERKAICQFGESIIPTVLTMFEDGARHNRHGPIVDFLRFQVSIHHPYGARSIEEGFYAKDHGLWTKHLFGIYSNVIDTWILNIRSKNALKSANQSTHLDPSLCDLGIEVVRQLFIENNEVTREITQIVNLNETISQQPSAKRRRVLQVGFESLLENIRNEDKNISIPWLQILSGLLFRYPKDSLTSYQFCNIFSQIVFVLQGSKVISVKREILKTLEALKILSSTCNFKTDWSLVWEYTLNIVSLNQCMEEGHSLIRLLMMDMSTRKLRRLMDIYMNKIVKCNLYSIQTLVSLITMVEIPHKISGRRTILSWLCPIDQGESLDSWNETLKDYPCVIVSLLVGLCLQSPVDLNLSYGLEGKNYSNEDLSQSGSSVNYQRSLSSAESRDSYSEESKRLETLILESDLIVLPDSSNSLFDKNKESSRFLRAQLNQPMFQDINDLLVKLSGEVLDRVNEGRNTENPAELVREGLQQAALLSSFITQLVKCNVFQSNESIQSSRLACIYGSCVKQSAMVSYKMLANDKSMVVLSIWHTFLSSKRSTETDNLLWNEFPLDFIEKAVQVFLFRCKMLKSSQSTESTRPINKVRDEFDDFDEFDSNVREEDSTGDSMDVDEFQEDLNEKLNQKKDTEQLFKYIVSISCPNVTLSLSSDRHSFFIELRKKIIEVVNSLPNLSDYFILEILTELIEKSCDDFLDEELIENILLTCQNIAKRSTRPKNFDPYVSIALLQILNTLVYHVHRLYFVQSHNPVSLKNFLMFLVAFFRMNAQSSYKRLSIRLQSKIIDVLHSLTTIDPSGKWALWPIKIHNLAAIDDREAGVIDDSECDSESVHVGKSMIRFLGHSSNRLREQSAKYVSFLFSSTQQSVKDKSSDFRLIYSTLNHLLKNRDDSSRSDDDTGNRIGTLLLTLSGISSCCEYLERESISKIVLMYQSYDISLVSIRRVIHNLSKRKGFDRVGNYMASMLGYVLKDFISEGFSIEKFPHKILNRDFKSFLLQYESVIVPLILWNNHESLQAISKLYAGKSQEKIIEENFSYISAYFLPIIAAKDAKPSLLRHTSKISIQKASKLHELVFYVLKKEAFNFNLTSKVHEILAEVFKNIHDPKALTTEFNLPVLELSEPSPPFTDHKLVLNLIEYFEARVPQRNDKSLLEFLGENISSCLLEMCLNFMAAFKTPTNCDTRIRSLHGVKIFLDSLHPSESFKHFHFIMWYISDSLLRALRDSKNSGSVIQLSLKVLYTLICTCVSHLPSIMNPYFAPIVNSLIPIHSDHESDVHSILDFLLIDNANLFLPEIRKLCPFPSDILFGKYNKVLQDVRKDSFRTTLLDDIESFLDDVRLPSPHRLKYLHESISSKKNEMESILEELNRSQILSENTKSSPVHSLIDKLLDIFLKNTHKELVSKCLGEIGPVNLNSVVIKPYKSIVASETNNPEKDYLREIIVLLLDLILDEHHPTSKMAYYALQVLCKLDIIQDIVNSEKMSQLHKSLLIPFYCTLENDEILKGEVLVNYNFKDASNWIIEENDDFDNWIKERVSNILIKYFDPRSFSIFTPLVDLCASNSAFCEHIFPFLVHVLLLNGDEGIKEEVSNKINTIFSEHYTSDSRSSISNKGLNPSSVMSCLNVVRHLRLQSLPRKRSNDVLTKWKNNFWLSNINYLHVARASLNTSEYFESILYSEIWTQQMVEKYGNIKLKMSESDRHNILDIIYELFPLESQKCQSILYEAFAALGNTDALNGCGESRLIEGDEIALIDHLAQERESFKVLGFCDSLVSKGKAQKKYLLTMFNSGLYHTLYSYIINNAKQVDEEDDTEIKDLRYECAWKLSQWDDVDVSLRSETKSFAENRYSCLSKLVRRDDEDLDYFIANARKSIHLNDVHSSIGVSKSLGQFMALREIECLKANDYIEESNHLNYKFSVDTKRQRCIFYLSQLGNSDVKSSVKDMALKFFVKECSHLAEIALDHSDFHVAKSCVFSLKEASVGNRVLKLKAQFLEAKLLWEWNNKKTAVLLLKKLANDLSIMNQDGDEMTSIYPQVLGTLGQWMYMLKSESAPIILDKYLQKSVSYYEELEDPKRKNSLMLEAYINLASFCDDQYQNISDHIKSKDFEDKQKLMKEIQEESSNLNQVGKDLDKDVKQSAVILNRHSNIDKLEVESIQRDRQKYLLLALQNYLNAFIAGDSPHDLKIFRFVSLWFSNSQDPDVSVVVSESINEIRTFKFVNLLYQLAARMTLKLEEGNFGKILMNLMVQCMRDHPHHTLPVVLALANSQADDAFTLGKGGKKNISLGDEDRTFAAKKLLQVFKKQDLKHGSLLKDMENICLTLIQFAYEKSPPPRSNESNKIKLGSSNPIRKICDMDHVPILTEFIPVSKIGKYSFVGIREFSDFYETVGGVNAPKKIYCIGTDGIKRPMLVKGKDDLRQDAVMQQVFNLMNSLLKDPKLKVQTYKVVALSQRSGVLEWCQNTMPLKDYLVGADNKSGAHARYHPDDYSAYDCRVKLVKAQASKDHLKKLKAFTDICEHFHPVMHQFFLEHFPSPEMHYERREAYTRSAAAASMVGYILGLGDRHIQNILIHKTTGHLVHIDLGIAFEQGKILPTPETIPFRLSRDIVDGFGTCGVEGTFRRSCESTLSVLRNNKESIFTILQVMVHDPLYNWSLTPDKAYRLQFGRAPDAKTRAKWEQSSDSPSRAANDGGGNRMAERVLLRVGQKLDGFEEGFNMSIQGQVNALIHQARDPNRLCALYPGWSPFV